MTGIAIVTDSASDLPPELAADLGVAVVPLSVTFGTRTFHPGRDLTTPEFWSLMTAPDAPFPTTAAPSPGDFREAFEAAFIGGADAVVCVDISGGMSGTVQAANVARDMLPEREIHVVDSRNVSGGVGLLVQIAAEAASAGRGAADVAAELEARKVDLELFVALETLEYVRRGGRLSGPAAAIGTMLSVKPVITVTDGRVDNADRVRGRRRARERVLELLTARPIERAVLLHAPGGDVEEFRGRFLERSGLHPEHVSVAQVGPSVGPHVGPGCVGGVVLRAR